MVWRKLGPLEVICGILMLVGVILSFFWISLGGILVGLSFGLYFSDELQGHFLKAKNHYTTESLFRTLLLLGVILYLLLTSTFFVIAAVIGFVIMTLVRFRRH